MSRRDMVLNTHREAICAAARRRKATTISLVGSVARGTDSADSDCDFLCDFSDDASLLDVVGLEQDLEALLGCKVQTCDRAALRSPFTSMLDDEQRLL